MHKIHVDTSLCYIYYHEMSQIHYKKLKFIIKINTCRSYLVPLAVKRNINKHKKVVFGASLVA